MKKQVFRKKKTPTSTIVATIVFLIITIICVFPIILLTVASFTDNSELLLKGYSLFPEKYSLAAYEFLMTQGNAIFNSIFVSIGVTLVGTILGLSFTVALAYALSIEELPGHKALMIFVFFTMLFNGGLVPTYFMYVNYFHIKNTYAALLIPYLLVNAFNVMLVRTYFANNIPSSIIEAARIDGAGEFRIFFKIVLPISTPILATAGMLIGLAYWNDWYNGMLFVTKTEYFSLQSFLNKIMLDLQFLATSVSASSGEVASLVANLPSNSVRMAMAVVAILPIIIIFPFFQKYFAKGITVGSVKE